jgi:uncharacterized protein YfaS (alpha-2-macroglobulin family)
MFDMRSPIASTLVLAGALALAVPACQQLAADAHPGESDSPTPADGGRPKVVAKMNPTAAWKEIDRLLDEQKLQQAADRLGLLVASAREAGDEANWAKALVRQSQVATGLGGLETAVEQMKAQPWPASGAARAAVELYYAHALLEYLSGYDWEIRQRERVVSLAPHSGPDLKVWTAEQISGEAESSFRAVWERRESLAAIPVSDFPYLRSNDYPKGVRGTLRDAVSYLFVDRLLADSSFWSASESNDVWQLDLGNLLADSPQLAAAATAAEGGRQHPLLRGAYVLADLERWHRGRGELAAELEARLARQRLLAGHRESAGDRARLRADLAGRLPRFRGDAWWAVGMAELASEVDLDSTDPEHHIRARELALSAERAYPGGHGAKLCRELRTRIEAPDFAVQMMAVDGAGRRSIEITHRNLAQLYLRAYPVDLAEQLARKEFRGLFPNDDREIERLIAGAEPAASWNVALPPTADYQSHRTFAIPPLTQPGLYLVVASAERSFARSSNRRVAVPFTLSNLVLLQEGQAFPWEVRLVEGADGHAAAGVEVTLYRNTWREAPAAIATLRTDATGRATFAAPDASGYANYLLVAHRGGDVAVAQRYGGEFQPAPASHSGALLFTDRAVYRPQQKLLWKVLGYASGPVRGALRPSPQTAIAVWLTDPNGEKVAEVNVATNRFGTAAGEFLIPAGRLLGQWTLQSSLGGAAAVRVEEYKRPTFEVELAAPVTELRLNRPAELVGEARYYFGLPVASGSVAWRVTRQPELPWWWRWWGFAGGSTESQPIASGTTTLGADGKFLVAFTPQADESDKAKGYTYIYRLEADVTDDGGETRSGERAVRLGWAAVEALAEKPTDLVVAGKPFSIAVRRQDLDGEPRRGAGTWRLLRLAQPDAPPLPADLPLRPAGAPAEPSDRFATPGDRLRPRFAGAQPAERALAYFADDQEVASGSVQHDAAGGARIELAALEGGAYRLRYETRDGFGEAARAQLDFVVAGTKTTLALPADLAFDRARAEPGTAARLWIHSGLAGVPAEVELLRGTERLWRRSLTLAGSQWIDVPVTEPDRGGLAARLTLVADHQLVTQGAALEVPWSNKELTVELSTFRDRLVPGAAETFRVTVKDAKGRPVEAGAAELLASMHDRSLDLFAPFSAPRPLGLFPTGAWFPQVATNLGSAGLLWYRDDGWVEPVSVDALSGDAFIEISPWGVGGPGTGFGGPMRRMQKGGVATMAMMADGAVPLPAAAAPAPQGVEGRSRDSATAASISREQIEELPGVRGGSQGGVATPPPVALRSNFAETAFWKPQLLTGADGSASIEFAVPDSVTSWRVWVAALSQTLASGYVEKSVESVKELMVRPYLPRFLREGDVARLKVVVNDAGETPLAGEATIEIFDPETNASLLGEFGLTTATAKQPFRVEPGKGFDLTFALTAPRRVGPAAFKVVARAGNLSDGELRPLPILPSRIHLAQSRFVTLKGVERREMTFDDMKTNDPTRIHEQMVVTVDGQLFYSMLDALPYLIEYPYECTEQTLNRFVSSGMLSSLFVQYPAVARAAEEMAKRATPLERFDAEDPNRRMALEETPWLRESRGGDEAGRDFLHVLDPAVALAQREDALAKLAKAQLPNGGFPWFAGGPASPYMTLYLMGGLARAAEFEVPVPREMVQRGFQYLAREAKEEWLPKALADDCCWELLTYLNYVAASYPDPSWTGDFLSAADRRTILDFSFKHWRDLQPLLKLQLASTLERMKRHKDAVLVLAAVMDSAKTSRDEGTFWQPEDRSWLWYNDRIESHAWALRTLMEVTPDDPRRDGLVQWLFLNKKLGHWKSTRATAEVLYSLASYLKATKTLAVREEARVEVAHQKTTFVFEPDRFTGKKNQIVVPGGKLDAVRRPEDATVVVEKTTPGLMFASATWHFSTEELPAESRSDLFGVSRKYFKRVKVGSEVTLEPLGPRSKLAVGDEVEVQLSLTAKAAAEYVHLRDPRPAGLEPDRPESGWKWDLGIARYEETRDSGANFFFEQLPAGEYTFKYRLRANLEGDFRSGPAEVQSIYAPEFVAYSTGERLTVEPATR